jgi:hypothetical protein
MPMLKVKIFTAISMLALTALACGISFQIPVDQIATGPTQTEAINIPVPDASPVSLTLAFGVGKLEVEPGAEGALVDGQAVYNVPEFKPKVTVDGGSVRLESGELKIKGIPNFGDKVKNNWDIKLGDVLMDLVVQAGAYEGDLELGGLPLSSLEVSDGAANVRLKFSQPNPGEMNTLRYSTGASSVRLTGLSNANFSSMIFRSGAGDYTLDFSGELKRDAVVTVESGISQVVIIVPDGTSARVDFSGGLTSVKTSGGWQKSGGAFVLGNGGPTITITIDMGAGNLELRTK